MPQPISAFQNITFTGDIRFNNDELKIEEQLNLVILDIIVLKIFLKECIKMQMLMVLKLDL